MTYLIFGMIGIGFFGITLYWNTVVEFFEIVAANVYGLANKAWTAIFG